MRFVWIEKRALTFKVDDDDDSGKNHYDDMSRLKYHSIFVSSKLAKRDGTEVV